MIRRPFPAAALAAALLAPAPLAAQPAGHHGPGAGAPDSAVFVTRLGADTLVLERMVRTPRRVETEVLMRVPRTTRTRWVLELGPAGEFERLEAVPLDPRTGAEGATGRRQTVTRAGDSLRVETTTPGGEASVRAVAAPPHVLPFIDMVHWPYEVALMRARAMSVSEVTQPLLTGARVSPFTIGRVGADSMTITHPSRGTMRVKVDADGRLLGLDAAQTTRKLVVERRPWRAIDSTAARWVAQDAAGRSAGELSGRAEARGTVHGATIVVDYGTPAKRGREIWGRLVPYGQVWRTGANRATHFTTDRPLVFGTGADTLVVPAGEYTLFSIPAADGGTLIVNRQTGQTGTAHDPARDLGRVPLVARPLPETVEVFTIAVEEEGERGVLRLQWDRTELVAPFRVRAP